MFIFHHPFSHQEPSWRKEAYVRNENFPGAVMFDNCRRSPDGPRLTGFERPKAIWSLQDWRIVVFTWSNPEIRTHYWVRREPTVERWVCVISPQGVHYLTFQTGGRSGALEAVRDIGFETYLMARSGGHRPGERYLSIGAHQELQAFVARVTNRSFIRAIRLGDRDTAGELLRLTDGLDEDRINVALDAAQASRAFGMRMTFDEALQTALATNGDEESDSNESAGELETTTRIR